MGAMTTGEERLLHCPEGRMVLGRMTVREYLLLARSRASRTLGSRATSTMYWACFRACPNACRNSRAP